LKQALDAMSNVVLKRALEVVLLVYAEVGALAYVIFWEGYQTEKAGQIDRPSLVLSIRV
jgi:hypothetical protein